MLDERDLQAIKSLMDAQEARFNARIDGLRDDMNGLEARMDAKMDGLEARMSAKVDDLRTEMHVILESDVYPKFQILAEGHETLLQTLAPKDRVEALEEEVSFLRQVVTVLSQDVAELKQAQ